MIAAQMSLVKSNGSKTVRSASLIAWLKHKWVSVANTLMAASQASSARVGVAQYGIAAISAIGEKKRAP